MRIVLKIILLFSFFLIARAAFPCRFIHCSYCPNARIDAECGDYCTTNCADRPTLPPSASAPKVLESKDDEDYGDYSSEEYEEDDYYVLSGEEFGIEDQLESEESEESKEAEVKKQVNKIPQLPGLLTGQAPKPEAPKAKPINTGGSKPSPGKPKLKPKPSSNKQPSSSKSGSKNDPNKKFSECCRSDKRIAPTCYNLCNFNSIKKQTLIDAYTRKTCPGHSVGPVLNCASAEKDHKPCCSNNGLGRSFHGGVCLDFCYPKGGLPPIDLKYLPCLEALQKIVACFKSGM